MSKKESGYGICLVEIDKYLIEKTFVVCYNDGARKILQLNVRKYFMEIYQALAKEFNIREEYSPQEASCAGYSLPHRRSLLCRIRM